jgi:acetolactate synthase-1/2/3 large subunit
MGCALPLAIGHKLAAPEHPVVAFVGDAGLEMVLGELATLRDLGRPVIIVVFVDESLALIELKQRRMGYPNAGVDFAGTDFPAIMNDFGMCGVWVEDRPSFEQALAAALDSNRSTLLACRIQRGAYDGTF